MKIVLCDDELKSLTTMEELVKELAPEADIEKYTSAKELINNNCYCDIAFLDIEVDDGNGGFEAAQYVKGLNSKCVITFFTNYDSYAREGYNYRAYRFILKDEGKQLIRHHFSETIKEYYRITGKISLLHGSGKKIVSVSDIMYIHMKDHYGDVYLANGEKYLWRKSLSAIEPFLSGFDFERCQKSYIVNMDYVKAKIKNQFMLTNGQTIAIGRTYIKAINSKYKNL